jgi:hypothetical protein
MTMDRLQQTEAEVVYLRSLILQIAELVERENRSASSPTEPALSVLIGRAQLADEIDAILRQPRTATTTSQ